MTTSTDRPAATLRPARPDDLPAIRRLLAASSLPADDVDGLVSDFVVAEADGALVGVAGLEPCDDTALLRSVAVDPAWRSGGLGGSLVRRVLADAEARGIGTLYLLTTTAERYFPAFGFEKIARESAPAGVRATGQFTSLCPSSAVVMRRAAGAS